MASFILWSLPRYQYNLRCNSFVTSFESGLVSSMTSIQDSQNAITSLDETFKNVKIKFKWNKIYASLSLSKEFYDSEEERLLVLWLVVFFSMFGL
ncbi:hypothetical protein L596_021320 [Steinernema carpocapsae]|uniref:Uncharacterized protein n=1 Tax=Steinernema carpocapsae TaxID=34508 RepID=A0A4V5ZZV3_STECR|nr:hypothetical protein L596_021320 [Steinernema carpocapsae]